MHLTYFLSMVTRVNIFMDEFLFMYILIGIIAGLCFGLFMVLRFDESQISDTWLTIYTLLSMFLWPLTIVVWLLMHIVSI